MSVNVLDILQNAFAILGLIAAIGTIVVSITPGDKDNVWWNKYILPFLPALVGGDVAKKIVGIKSIDKDVLIFLIERARKLGVQKTISTLEKGGRQ